MRIHHLNCGTLTPFWPRVTAITYCLLIESTDGLILVDTGFGVADIEHPSWKMRVFLAMMHSKIPLAETAQAQVQRLGFALSDVRHIVLTHLHIDHSGGLPDFPHAQVHVNSEEYAAAQKPHGLMDWAYDRSHWQHRPQWVFHEPGQEQWFDMPATRILPDLYPAIYLVPLPGHSRGHCGVAIETGTGWLFHAGDAASVYHRAADLHGHARSGPSMDILPEAIVKKIIGAHVPELRRLLWDHADEIDMISAHDEPSFQRFTSS